VQIIKDTRDTVTFSNDGIGHDERASVCFCFAHQADNNKTFRTIEDIVIVDGESDHITLRLSPQESNWLNNSLLALKDKEVSSSEFSVTFTENDECHFEISYDNFGEPFREGLSFEVHVNGRSTHVFIELHEFKRKYLNELKLV
jgi:hypothetical protein